MRTVVALFDRFEDAQNAINALNTEGFQKENLNLIANDVNGEYARSLGLDPNRRIDAETHDAGSGAAAGAGLGAVLGGIGGLLVGLGALAIPGVGPVLAAGPIVSALAGAGIGAVAGGLVGALVDLGVPEEHAQYYAEGVRRGGSLVTVRVDDTRADQVRDLLNRFNPVDIETRARTWRDRENWTGYDPNAEPLDYDRMEFNRTHTMPVTGSDVDRDRDYGTGGMGTIGTTDTDYNRDREQGMTGRGMTGSAYDRGEGSVSGSGFDADDLRTGDLDRGIGVTGSTQGGADTMGGVGPSKWDTSSAYDRDNEEAINRMDDHMRDDVFGRERSGLPEAEIPPTGGGMGATEADMVGTDWVTYDQSFRADYQSRFGMRGQGYDYYQPAYRYGYDLAMDPRYRDYDWDRIEMDARRDWEMRGDQSTWEDVKDAVRHAWRSVTGRW